MITLSTRLRLVEDVLFTNLGREAVLVNLQTKKYYGLDEIGASLWSLIGQYEQVEPVYLALQAEYDVGPDHLLKDMLSLINDLIDHGLLQVVEA